MLLDMAIENVVERSTGLDAEHRAEFLIAVRIVAELHDPIGVPARIEKGANPMGLTMLDPEMREAVLAEGVDPEKELGAHDPRANHPRCAHGRKFSEPCRDCSPPAGDPRAFDVTQEERLALDRALEDRQRETRAGQATESVWCNFDEPRDLHDARFVGKNFTDRQRIQRKAKRWADRLLSMAPGERAAVLEEIQKRLSAPE